MIDTFRESHDETPIPRVAIMVKASYIWQCCRSPMSWSPQYGDFPEVLHGVDTEKIYVEGSFESEFKPGLSKGCPGLQEVFWVVQSNLWKKDVRQIDSQVGLRAMSSNGLWPWDKLMKESVQKEYEQGVKTELRINNVGENKWVGDNMPRYYWVSLAPRPYLRGVDGVVHSGAAPYPCGFNFWGSTAGQQFLKRIEKQTNCSIELAALTPQLASSWGVVEQGEVGFTGTKTTIRYAKALRAKETEAWMAGGFVDVEWFVSVSLEDR
ncbi:hypothetical protein B0J14DRAFT_655127 [Halenospora varia]|nr:hypothetical protein B0J14DRAFT_655127 [Halenospora varia]